MTTTVKLPYYAPSIPCPLPTISEINAAPDISLAYSGRRIVQIGQHIVVKFGKGVDLIEGENMIFVRENTNIHVPRVYALYTDSETAKNYIIMEKISGQSLSSIWPHLSLPEKDCIIATLRDNFNELRQLAPPDYYGSLGRRYFLDGIFWTQNPEPAINGPFSSGNAVIEAMAQKYTYDGRSSYRADFYRQCLPRVLHDHGPIFTHGDFQRKNIIVQKAGEQNSGRDPQFQVVILDWERSGWYPTYWEYSLAICALRWDDDWCLQIDKVLEPYSSEASWLQSIRLELWS